MTAPFRFSFNVYMATTRAGLVSAAKRGEEWGYDVALTADHVAWPSPFSTLATIAENTDRLRVGTLVLSAPFWNPGLLAREVLTLDAVSNGRFELGLGAGHMKWQADEVGVDWPSPAGRRAHLARLLDEVRARSRDGLGHLRDPHTAPGPDAGAGPPVLVGGSGTATLTMAARSAAIVGFSGIHQLPGRPPGVCRVGTAEDAEHAVDLVERESAGRARAPERHMMVHAVEIADDRQRGAARLLDELALGVSPEDVLRTPFVLVGTTEQIAAQVLESRARYGFSYLTVHEPQMEAFAPVIAAIRDQERTTDRERGRGSVSARA